MILIITVKLVTLKISDDQRENPEEYSHKGKLLLASTFMGKLGDYADFVKVC